MLRPLIALLNDGHNGQTTATDISAVIAATPSARHRRAIAK